MCCAKGFGSVSTSTKFIHSEIGACRNRVNLNEWKERRTSKRANERTKERTNGWIEWNERTEGSTDSVWMDALTLE